ncbi:hypothetical protein ABIC63_001700 [Pseudacidovorax sp. 1753]|uniref:hypothetical protein n=1 Tax=Pseudacidovorax sp. 1753 TaxID=3156419 RepID=UPI00339A5189
MKIDRDLQRSLLEQLRDDYPTMNPNLIRNFAGGFPEQERKVVANLLYLQAHGLVEAGKGFEVDEEGDHRFWGVRISARGIDFLEQDGGLSAILGVVTIQLHDDTIKSLIEARIEASDLPPPEKKRYLDQLRELPGETTKHLALKLVDLGLEKLPQAIALIGKVLG